MIESSWEDWTDPSPATTHSAPIDSPPELADQHEASDMVIQSAGDDEEPQIQYLTIVPAFMVQNLT